MEREELKLEKPTIKNKEQVMNYKKVFLENNQRFHGCSGLEEVDTYEEWLDFENRFSKKYGKEYVPSTTYLAIRIEDNKLIGMVYIKHRLTDFLYNYGGNIGYSVLPAERKKGYAKEILKLALEKCKEIGMKRVLITCDKDNIGSSKTIKANGGVLENEVKDEAGLSDSGYIQRYWISLKKRYADKTAKNRASECEQKIINVNTDVFKGEIYFYNFIKVERKLIVPKGLCILDEGYKWLEFYDYNSKVKLSAVYDGNCEIVEWYFDIARRIGKDNGIPYEDDLYLDVVATPEGDIILLDEDELQEAFERKEMTKEEFDEAYEVANDLMKKLENNVEGLKKFTDDYLNWFLKE